SRNGTAGRVRSPGYALSEGLDDHLDAAQAALPPERHEFGDIGLASSASCYGRARYGEGDARGTIGVGVVAGAAGQLDGPCGRVRTTRAGRLGERSGAGAVRRSGRDPAGAADAAVGSVV